MSDTIMRQKLAAQSSSAAAGASPSPSQPSYGTVSGSIPECGPRTQMQGLDSNLESLCEHIQAEGWNSRAFSDIVVQAMGSTFYLHRLLLSRSSYFRNMLQGPWKEANARELKLQIDDENVNVEAVTTALAYLYGQHPKLDNRNAFRVLAAASFLDLQELCSFCTDFIISDLWTENFLSYQAFAERQDYGIHGEKVGKACWGYICRGGAVELREVLPKLSSQTLRKLLTSDELWVHSEEKRFELALSVLLSRGVVTEIDSCSLSDECSEPGPEVCSFIYGLSRDAGRAAEGTESEIVRSILLDMVDSVATGIKEKPEFPCETSVEVQGTEDAWRHQQGHSPETAPTHCASPSWGGRVVGRRLMKAYPSSDWTNNEDWEAFMSIFEGGGIHYCHMHFEDLLDARARLEELGFPCKSVADGLWLHTLLRQQILSIAADTCKICSLALASCSCKQYVYPPHGRISTPTSFRDEPEKIQNIGAENQGASNGTGRVHVRGTIDGLAGIGRGNAYVAPVPHWPSSRFMFTRLSGPGVRGNQQQHQVANNDQGDADLPGYSDGLNMVVGLSQGISSGVPGQSDQSTGRQEEPSASNKAAADSAASFQYLTMGDACQSPSISLDLRTPLRCFPPFRFGVEFEELHKLTDGSKHSPEVFYAGSLWKVSVQAFNEEDPRCRRTLGLFLHRRKADDSGPSRKVSLYIDSREKVTARYQLICPAKRGVMVLGSLTQAGTLLPKAPKGWGWRTAILYDDLVDLLQGNSLRVAAVVQVV